jgi:hypothetical protein
MERNYNFTKNSNQTAKSRLNDNLVERIIGIYIFAVVLIIGTILNLISLIVFYRVVREERSNRGNMFKYLLMKCICDFLLTLLFLPSTLMINEESYIKVALYKWNYYYFMNIFSTCSSIYEIFSSLDCLFFISKKSNWFIKKTVFYFVNIFILMFTVPFYTPGLFRYQMVQDERGYYLEETPFKQSTFIKHYFLSFHYFMRDGISLIASIIINLIIVLYLKQRTRMKVILTSNKGSFSVIAAHASEIKRMKLTIFTSFLVIFRIPSVLNYSLFNYKSNVYFNIALVSSYISYSISFFGFFLYNNKFKKILKQYIAILLNVFKKVRN